MIDWTRVAELRDEIGAEDFEEIVESFLMEVETTLAELPETAGNAPEIEARLHYLKGSALTLGFTALSDLCQAGESAAHAGDAHVDLGAIAALYETSRDHFLRELPKRCAA